MPGSPASGSPRTSDDALEVVATVNVMVTGGAGFIGSMLVDRLLAGGHHVEVVDDLSTGSLGNLASARHDSGGRLKIHQCDVRDDAFVALITRHRPELVFHLATCTARGEETSAAVSAEIDVVGTVQLLEGVRAARVRKVVTTGSLRAGSSTSLRAATREMAVELIRREREVGGIECTVIDLPTVYGPRQQRGRESSVVATFAERFAHEQPCVVHGSGDQTRDLLYVDDAVDALAKAIDRGDGLRLAVGTGSQTSVRSLYRAMAAVAGVTDDPVPGAARPDEPGAVPADPSRAKLYLGWEPFTTLAEGLTDTMVSASR